MNFNAEYSEEMIRGCLDNWKELHILAEDNQQSVNCILVDIKASLKFLEDRDRKIVHQYFIKGLKQQQVADFIGVSQQYLSRTLIPNIIAEINNILKESGYNG